MGYRVGEYAGPYQVLQLIGRGTFGEVLLARDPRRLNHRVALKTVSCDQLTGEAVDRVRIAALREAELLRRLKHPHIVRCEEAIWDSDRRVVCLALELMDGGDVQNLVDGRRKAGKGPFEPHFVRRVLAAVGSALCYIHGEGVLHRDVKPANILIQRRSHRITLADFGISKLLESTGRARTVVGTPYYLSPEIVSGQAYGAAADAWALGVCLFELAALHRPFEAGNPLALVRRICEEDPIGLPQETAPDILRAIFGLLQRDPLQRLLLSEALAVSDQVAVLAVPTDEISHTHQGFSLPTSPQSLVNCNELSPVSIATTETGSASSPCEAASAEILASLRHADSRRPHTAASQWQKADWHWAGQEVEAEAEAVEAGWQVCEAIRHARLALSADVDDPEELQQALLALEQVSPWRSAAHEALGNELRLRISALRADAAALLQSLLDGPEAGERTGLALPPQWVPMGGQLDSVTTVCAEDDVAALETAIELATSLGVDTGPAESIASARGLLSLRVVWGSFTRFLLLPLHVPFRVLFSEVARRFGLPCSSGGACFSFELWCREGSEVSLLSDQTAWENCLRRRRLRRLELRLEALAAPAPLLRRVRCGSAQAPFVVMGTRISAPGKENEGAWGQRGHRPPLPFSAQKHLQPSSSAKRGAQKRERKSTRDFAEAPAIAVFGAPATPASPQMLGPRTVTMKRSSCKSLRTPIQAALQLEGRGQRAQGSAFKQ